MIKYFLASSLLCFAVHAVAADTKTVTSHSGTCTVSVPGSWTVDPTIGSAHNADNTISLVVTSPSHGLNSLSDVETMAPTIYKNDSVTKKSGSEFEMEGKSITGKPNVYRAIPAGGKVCIVEIMYTSGTAEEARAIVETMKAK
jgi:hypothetical protein